MNKSIRKILQYILFLALGIYLLYNVLTDPETKLDKVWEHIQSVSWSWVIVSLVAGLITHISRAMRWQILLEGGGFKAKLLNIYNAIMSGYFTNTAIPRAGEFVRCGLVKKTDKVPFTTALGTAMVERLVDIITLFTLVFVALFAQYDLISDFFDLKIFTPIGDWVKEKSTTKNLIILGALAVAGVYFLIKSGDKIEKAVEDKGKGSIDDIVDDIWAGLGSILKLKRTSLFVFHSLFIWLGYFLINYFIFLAFDRPSLTSVQIGIAVLVVGSVSKMIPTQAHGMGTFIPLVAAFLEIYNIGHNEAIAIATVIHGSQFLYYVFGGAISYVWITFFTQGDLLELNEQSEEQN